MQYQPVPEQGGSHCLTQQLNRVHMVRQGVKANCTTPPGDGSQCGETGQTESTAGLLQASSSISLTARKVFCNSVMAAFVEHPLC